MILRKTHRGSSVGLIVSGDGGGSWAVFGKGCHDLSGGVVNRGRSRAVSPGAGTNGHGGDGENDGLHFDCGGLDG